MSRDNEHGFADLTQEDEAVSRLLHRAGRRPTASAAARARGRLAAHQVWQRKVERHAARRRRQRILTLAAAALLAIGGAWLWQQLVVDPGPVLGVVVATFGDDLEMDPATRDLYAGDGLETGDHRLALRLASGESVRLDHDSRLRLLAEGVMELEHGAVYIDSGPLPTKDGGIEIRTPFATARDIGTQFTVRLLDDGLRLQVREGEVRVTTHDATTHDVHVGGALVVGKGGAVEHLKVPAHGEPWAWTLEAAPAFELEGRTLSDFLDWVTQETGWTLELADPALETALAESIAHGTLAAASPAEAPALVLPAAGLRHEVNGGVLRVARHPHPPAPSLITDPPETGEGE